MKWVLCLKREILCILDEREVHVNNIYSMDGTEIFTFLYCGKNGEELFHEEKIKRIQRQTGYKY
jgi:hypothetical protein